MLRFQRMIGVQLHLRKHKLETMRKFSITITVIIICSLSLRGQVVNQFSGDITKFPEELLLFMGKPTTETQESELKRFTVLWDSTAYSTIVKDRIVNVSSQMRERKLRPSPTFYTYINTLLIFFETKQTEEKSLMWLSSLSEIIFDPRYSSSTLDKYIEMTGLIAKDNTIYDSGSTRWKINSGKAEFVRDTSLFITINDATVTCYSAGDSMEIYHFNGTYYPDSFILNCENGQVTWEKAGYNKDEVHAKILSTNINVTQNTYTCDSAMLTHSLYFKAPVAGKLTDKSAFISSPEEATYPRFETFKQTFKIANLYKDVDYEGGLTLEGSIVRGTGSSFNPASLNLYRNDTLYVKIRSKNFVLSQKSLSSSEVSATIFLDQDSVFHSNVGFSYSPVSREMSLFRTQSPISGSPYFDSFHNLDMYFENLTWDMNSSLMVMSRPKSASVGQARFESVSFYNEKNFFRLMRLEDVHPLYLVRDYAKRYGSETFPVEGFAKWMKMPQEQTTSMCIELANSGYLFYDRSYNEVTVKKKVDDYIACFAKKKDYDDITIDSETSGSDQNAVLDMKNYRMTISGVPAISLSDSQKVAIFPYGNKVVVGKNRSISFDGVVQAGLFTVFGKEFTFKYDTFYIRLQKVDSIIIAVETGEKDAFGKPISERINNIIQLGTAELYIDDPKNKSGLKSYKQYPIINAITFSYIFYDKIPKLEGVYPQTDFYFRVDPFTYSNIDHYTNRDMSLAGEFVGGGILEPMRQTLTIQPDNSLGFSMVVPEEGLPVYSGKGQVFDYLSMSNSGLISSGKLNHLTTVTVADTFRFFPDSMSTRAMSFNMSKDGAGMFPDLVSTDVAIRWLTKNDDWLVKNSRGKDFNMYANGTTMDGLLTLRPSGLRGEGVVNMSDSRITSNTFSFRGMNIDADTSDYYLKALHGSGYGFVATNANSHVNFDTQHTAFSLNTDSSLVVLPEIEYICKMTNFDYNMQAKTLDMWQQGRETTPLMAADELLKIPFKNIEKPTFFSTNNMKDTVSFASGKGTYFLKDEYMKIDNVNYVKVADALIQPGEGSLTISKGAKIKKAENSIIAVSNKHIIHDAGVTIESSAYYTGGGIYDYIDYDGTIQQISFPDIKVDTMATSATGYIPVAQNFMLSPAFTYSGDVSLRAARQHLRFTGAAGIVTNCKGFKTQPVKFSAVIDPNNILIPISDKPRDINDNLVFSGSEVSLDSAGVYPTFLSERMSWSDNLLISSEGFLFFDKGSNRYKIASLEKLSDQSMPGNIVTFDKNYCILSGEGKINFGTNYNLLKLESTGKVIQNSDSTTLSINALIGLSFYFNPEALKMMADEIKMIPTLKSVNLATDFYKKSLRELIGDQAANTISEDLQLYGSVRTMPKEFAYQLFLNDVKLVWDTRTMSFVSKGKIGIGFINGQPMNIYVDGYVELQRKRSGDLLDVYLKANDGTWYWFSYFPGVMMSLSSNRAYDDLISNTKENARRDPGSSGRAPYKYMIGLPDRLSKFLRKMEGGYYDEGENNE